VIRDKSILAIIPARGGTKGLPRKNIRMLAGKPLIAWTIEEAKKARYIDRLILSSEDNEIIDTAKQLGCEVPFVRPAELAMDETPGILPILHAIDTINDKYDYVVMLQPTSPLRQAIDIDGCIEMCLTQKAPACISVVEPGESPYLMFKIDNNGLTVPITDLGFTTARRQDLPRTYAINGAVYVFNTDWIKKNPVFMTSETRFFIMPRERSWDIDTTLDLKICDFLLSNKI